ncbi:MAG: hypothetical protein GSR78_04115, partial [Desulfurococcales archaeon]|nr:hypothetical protein [Desulfurococcales archaeon]
AEVRGSNPRGPTTSETFHALQICSIQVEYYEKAFPIHKPGRLNYQTTIKLLLRYGRVHNNILG